IEASSFTKTLTIAGNLGTVPNYEEARNNYDTVRIDLSKTSGVNLDISRLLVSNPNDDGIQITASKGQDNITLVAGANHDVIEFTAGGGAGAVAETYTIDLGNLRLGKNQSFTIDGVTITNIADGLVLTANDIAAMLAGYAYAGSTAGISSAAGGTWSSATGDYAAWGFDATNKAKYKFDNASTALVSQTVSIEGKFESLTKDWLTTSGTATLKHVAGESSFTITANSKANLKDLNFTFDGNGNAAVPDNLKADVIIGRKQGFATVQGTSVSAGGTISSASAFSAKGVATGGTTTFIFNVDGSNHTIQYVADTSTATATAGALTTSLKAILTGASSGSTAAGFKILVDGTEYVAPSGSDSGTDVSAFGLAGFQWGGATGTLTFANIMPTTDKGGTIVVSQVGGSATATTVTFNALPNLEESTTGQIVVDFGQGLLAGQSYTFNNKTVVATKDLTGAEVAEAFTYTAGEAFDGAVIVSDWATSAIVESKVLYGIDGSKLTILDTKLGGGSSAGILSAASDVITGTGALAVNTNRVTASTTQQGQNQEEILASSYVVFSASELGSAAAGSADGVAANIKAVTSALDTITNFDVANDKLLLNKFDENLTGTVG
ncbi:MAG: hypothetical protein K2M51_03940, partial [Helicobacter sp.]|nr:hypothetical protein [Helicobacter sp.]